jgi:hypothetical protein
MALGVNHVETGQTRDSDEWPQDYGGFSTVTEKQRQDIVVLVLGEDGLKPGIVKTFIDLFHERMDKGANASDEPMKVGSSRYTHERTRKWVRYFVREGSRRTGGRRMERRTKTTSLIGMTRVGPQSG